MNNIKKFIDFVNESELPSWTEDGPYDTLGYWAKEDDMTIADVNKNYKPALKYLGVRSIDNMVLVTNVDSSEAANALSSQIKSSNFLGNDSGKGMDPAPYTTAYKGMLGDVKIIIVQDNNQENAYGYAAGDSRGNLI